MTKIPTVRIKDPSHPADYVVINESDFDPKVHELYEEPKGAKKAKAAAEGEKKGDDGPQLPEGYTIEAAGGAYKHLYGPEGQLIEGPNNGKWQGEAAAAEAAIEHAAQAAKE